MGSVSIRAGTRSRIWFNAARYAAGSIFSAHESKPLIDFSRSRTSTERGGISFGRIVRYSE